jgi:hypothetical protein
MSCLSASYIFRAAFTFVLGQALALLNPKHSGSLFEFGSSEERTFICIRNDEFLEHLRFLPLENFYPNLGHL